MTSNFPHNMYQQIEVNTSNSLQLVVMLYDGAIRFLNQAKASIQNKNLFGKAVTIDRSLAIIGELQSTLNFEEGGEIATSLDKLYAYMRERLIEASTSLDVTDLDEVIKLLKTLNSGWTEIARNADTQNSVAQISLGQPVPTSNAQPPTGTRRALEVFG